MSINNLIEEHTKFVQAVTESLDDAKETAEAITFSHLIFSDIMNQPESHLGELKTKLLSSLFPFYHDCIEHGKSFGKIKCQTQLK